MKYTKEQRLSIMKEVQETGNRSLVARKYEISESTIRGWEKRINNTESKASKELEKENKLLKQIIADKELELAILRDVVKKK